MYYVLSCIWLSQRDCWTSSNMRNSVICNTHNKLKLNHSCNIWCVHEIVQNYRCVSVTQRVHEIQLHSYLVCSEPTLLDVWIRTSIDDYACWSCPVWLLPNLSSKWPPHLQPFLHLPLAVTGTVLTSPSAGSSLAPVQTPLQSDREISDFSQRKNSLHPSIAHSTLYITD